MGQNRSNFRSKRVPIYSVNLVTKWDRIFDELEAAYRKLVDRVVEQSEELAALRIEDAPPPHY